VSLTLKRSGAYRELVFPTVIDGIVGRCLIDAIEPQINIDDDGKTFSGRTHFNNNRERGDYDDWFQVWQDYSAAIDAAADREGFTYVFDTDVHDFFPSIDRTRAKALIAAKTGAHASMLELLFYCLEAWLPRFGYAPMTGLPVEQNDVSRVVAHGYLKTVDAVFKSQSDCIYLRYCDDTVIFARSKDAAQRLRRQHHLQLRQLGLNPNSAKSEVMSVEEFLEKRNRSMNLLLDDAKQTNDTDLLQIAIDSWWNPDKRGDSWDKIARKTYSFARQMKCDLLRKHAIHDAAIPSVASAALKYLATFDLTHSEVIDLLEFSTTHNHDMSGAIGAVATVLDARIEPQFSSLVVEAAREVLYRDDVHEGIGYLKGQWLLALHKHGTQADHQEIGFFGVNLVDDPMWRLHYLYVALATGILPLADAATASALANSDMQLALRLCSAAASGKLQQRGAVLRRLVTRVNDRPGIFGRHLPFVRILVASTQDRKTNIQWLKRILDSKPDAIISDPVVYRFLQEQYESLTVVNGIA
jgi:hypothetical protein